MSNQLSDIVPIIIVAIVLWNAGLTVVFYRILSHYRKIASKTNEGDLVKAMESVLKAEADNAKTLELVQKQMRVMDKNAEKPIQKVGYLRFNPFHGIGGEQSFAFCLLNRQNTGFIVTGLHTRDRSRVYTKPVKNGTSSFDLSKEEQKVLALALKN